MKNLKDYSAKLVCPSSYLTRLHMELLRTFESLLIKI